MRENLEAHTAQGKLCVSAVNKMSRSRLHVSREEGTPGFVGRNNSTVKPLMALQEFAYNL